MQYLLLGVLLYLLYKIIFRFVLPIYRTTKKIKQQLSSVKEQMEQQFGGFANTTAQQTEPIKEKAKDVKKDYIDFEDVNN